MRFVSRSVVIGFVNALAILIFMAQLPELTNVSWVVYAMTAPGLGIIYLFPYITRSVPSPLVCIVVLTIASMALGLDIRTVGDMGELPDSLPVFLLPSLPLTFETLQIIFPYAATLAVVVLTHDLAKGVLVGVLLSGIFFAHKVGRVFRISSQIDDVGTQRTYTVAGQVFFASADTFTASFDFREVIEKVRIDLHRARFWDITAVSALDSVILKFRREGTQVEVVGLDEASSTLVDQFAVHEKASTNFAT